MAGGADGSSPRVSVCDESGVDDGGTLELEEGDLLDLELDLVERVEYLSLINFGLGRSLELGFGKLTDGSSASTAAVYPAQIWAGYEPPVTFLPPTFFMETLPTGDPIHTAVASCGV